MTIAMRGSWITTGGRSHNSVIWKVLDNLSTWCTRRMYKTSQSITPNTEHQIPSVEFLKLKKSCAVCCVRLFLNGTSSWYIIAPGKPSSDYRISFGVTSVEVWMSKSKVSDQSSRLQDYTIRKYSSETNLSVRMNWRSDEMKALSKSPVSSASCYSWNLSCRCVIFRARWNTAITRRTSTMPVTTLHHCDRRATYFTIKY